MGVIAFLLFCAVVGFICWLLTLPQVPIAPQFKSFIPIAGIALCIAVLLYIMLGGSHDVAIPRLR